MNELKIIKEYFPKSYNKFIKYYQYTSNIESKSLAIRDKELDIFVKTYIKNLNLRVNYDRDPLGSAYTIPHSIDLNFEQKQYQIALEYIDQMLDSTRTNPFPEYGHFIDATLYYDSSSNRLQNFRQTILNKLKEGEKNIMDTMFIQNTNSQKRLFVVDEFYANPDEIRNFALTQVEYNEDLRFYKGMRSVRTYRPEWIKQAFEKIIGQPINHWDEHDFNGVFQIVSSENPQVIHYDLQRWAAIVYLTPNAPIESGTRTHRSRINGARHRNHLGADEALGGMFYDMTRFDVCDSVGNIYNRLIIMDAEAIHSAGLYFGNSMHNGRLTHLFFFD